MDFPHFSKPEGTRRICAAFGLVKKILHFVKSVPDKIIFHVWENAFFNAEIKNLNSEATAPDSWNRKALFREEKLPKIGKSTDTARLAQRKVETLYFIG